MKLTNTPLFNQSETTEVNLNRYYGRKVLYVIPDISETTLYIQLSHNVRLEDALEYYRSIFNELDATLGGLYSLNIPHTLLVNDYRLFWNSETKLYELDRTNVREMCKGDNGTHFRHCVKTDSNECVRYNQDGSYAILDFWDGIKL
mgnify:CR=1 FL=1